MPQIETEAVLLRAVDFGETDRIVHLLTPRSGRLTAMAKSARKSVKRFGGSLDILNHLQVKVRPGRRGRMAHIEKATLIQPFLGLRESGARFGLACYVLELFDRFAPEGGPREDMARLFQFALGTLGAIDQAQPDLRMRILIELRALDALGLRPELQHCVRCGRTPEGSGQIGFHIPDGGAVCGACSVRLEGVLPVHWGTLRALHHGLQLDLSQLERLALSPGALREAAYLVSRFQRFHVGVTLRSERFLDEVLRLSAA